MSHAPGQHQDSDDQARGRPLGETAEPALANLREALELYFGDEPLPTDVQ